MMEPKHKGRRRLGLLLFVPPLFGVLFCIFIFVSATGTAVLLRGVASGVSHFTDWDIAFEGVEGALRTSVTIKRILVSDDVGPCFLLENIHAAPRLSSFMQGYATLEQVDIERLTVLRRPVPKKKWRIPRVPAFLSRIRIDRLALACLQFPENTSAAEHPLTLSGRIVPVSGRDLPEISLDVKSLQNNAVTGSISFSYVGAAPRLLVHFEDSAFAPDMIGIAAPLKLEIRGDGPRDSWQASFLVEAQDTVLANGTLQLGEADLVTAVSGRGEVFLEEIHRFASGAEILGNHIEGRIQCSLDTRGELVAEAMALRSEKLLVSGKSRLSLPDRTGTAQFDLAYTPEETAASCRMALRAESDGKAVRYEIEGTGTSGEFLGGEGSLALQDDYALIGSLALHPGRFSAISLPFAPEEKMTSAYALRYSPEETQLTVEYISVEGAGASASFSGRLDLEEDSFEWRGSGSVSESPWLQNLHGFSAEGAWEISLHAASREGGGEADLSVAGDGLRWKDWAGGALTGTLHLNCDSWRHPAETPWHGKASLQCDSIVQYHEAASGEGEALMPDGAALTLELAGLGAKEIRIEDLRLQAAEAALMGQGRILPEEARAEAAFTLDSADGGKSLAAFVFLPSFALKSSIEGNLSWDPLSLAYMIRGTVQQTASTPPSLASWLEEKGLSFELAGQADPEKVEMKSGKAAHAAGSLSFEGSYGLKDGSLLFTAEGEDIALKTVGKLLDQDLAGKAGVKASLSGTLAGAKGQLILTGKDVQRAPLPPLALQLKIQGEGPVRMPSLDWKGTLAAPEAKLHFTGQGSVEAEHLSVERFDLALGDNRGSFRAVLPFDLKKAELHGSLTAGDLSAFTAIAGMPVAGAGEGAIDFADNRTQSTLDFRDVQAGSFRASGLSLRVEAERLDRMPSGQVQLKIEQPVVGKAALDRVQAVLSGTLESAQLRLQINEMPDKKTEVLPLIALIAESDVSLQQRTARLHRLDLAAERAFFTLKEASRLQWSDSRIVLNPVVLTSGERQIRLEGNAGQDELIGSVKIAALPLSLLEGAGLPGLSGTLQGEASLGGTPEHPELKSSFAVKELGLKDGSTAGLPPASAKVELQLMEGYLHLRALAEMEPGMTVKTQARCPLPLRFKPWHLSLDKGGSLDGQIHFDADFKSLLKEMALIPHGLEGKLSGDFSIGGSLAAPLLTGAARFTEGQYTNITTGTSLRDFQFQLKAQDGTLLLQDCTARTGQQGMLKVDGHVLLDFEKHFPLALNAVLDQAQVVHLAYARAVASGPLQLQGDLQGMLLSGTLEITPVEATMPDQLMLREPPRLEVIEMGQEPAAAKSASLLENLTSRIRLDVNCSMPRKIYVRAPILDSEWKGVFHVGGTLSNPLAEGRISALRGTLDFLNQRFQLSDSAVLLTGKSIFEPTMDLRAVVETREISATVRLEGEMSTMVMKLESSPSLPQDEILSHILFGKDLARISPVQALQLARVAAMFNRDLGGLRFFTGQLSISGIDRIDLRTGEKIDDAAVGLGKYFTDSVYVEVEQGTTSDSGRISVEVELSPQLSIKGDVDARDRSGVGLFWRKDY